MNFVPKVGSVFRFNYLWKREQEKGEETGRKSRPACLLIKLASPEHSLLVFAITSQKPTSGRIAMELPLQDCKTCNLKPPAWIILDETNIVAANRLHDFESLEPIGALSSSFILSLQKRARETILAGKIGMVVRT
jgi:hypothetical protein